MAAKPRNRKAHQRFLTLHEPGEPKPGRAGGAFKSEPARSRGGALFKAWRKRHGYSQWSVALALGMKWNQVSRFENSHTFPSLPLAVKIERLTGIPPAAWVESLEELALQHLDKPARRRRKRGPSG